MCYKYSWASMNVFKATVTDAPIPGYTLEIILQIKHTFCYRWLCYKWLCAEPEWMIISLIELGDVSMCNELLTHQILVSLTFFLEYTEEDIQLYSDFSVVWQEKYLFIFL